MRDSSFNESFAATNEREGTEIARQIVATSLDDRARMFFVTHMFEFASGFAEEGWSDVASLRAERRDPQFQAYRGGAFAHEFWRGSLYWDIFAASAGGAHQSNG
ncbi:hypothetical protein N2600_19835 [Rhizobium sp. WSM1274]|uniref:hypothetical protein n=1 Tax=Rhizobium TaxID=379 RepID=UPI001C939777|nr:hypothetical protein [Rhizobium leguminosarum]MBY5405499.1 hypothetical protein [Rhizobium leguminosarum]UWU27592.1 hypothetical protein N2600_19835 [Rhizobium leguminosarum bv. viciae]